MSELIIGPDLGETLDCEIGDAVSLTVTGKVTAKNSDGGKTIDVESVENYSESSSGEQSAEPDYDDARDRVAPKKKEASAVMIMLGKK